MKFVGEMTLQRAAEAVPEEIATKAPPPNAIAEYVRTGAGIIENESPSSDLRIDPSVAAMYA